MSPRLTSWFAENVFLTKHLYFFVQVLEDLWKGRAHSNQVSLFIFKVSLRFQQSNVHTYDSEI